MPDAPRIERRDDRDATYFRAYPFAGERTHVSAARIPEIFAHLKNFHAPETLTVSWPSLGSVSTAEARAFARAILAVADAVGGDVHPSEEKS